MEEGVKKKNSYWWIIILVILVGVWIYVRNQPTSEEMTFVVVSGHSWTSCYNSTSNLTISYDLASSSAVDLLFTPTNEDAQNLTEASMHYPSCYAPKILNKKGECVIPGNGCIVLLNEKENDATVNLKYSAIEIS